MKTRGNEILFLLVLLSLKRITKCGTSVQNAMAEPAHCDQDVTCLTTPSRQLADHVTTLTNVIVAALCCDFERSFMVVHDNVTAPFVPVVALEMTRTGGRGYRYMIDMSCNKMMLQANVLSNNNLLLADTHCLHMVLHWASAVDSNRTLGTYLRHTSRWFIVTLQSELTSIKSIMAKFDHVTVLALKEWPTNNHESPPEFQLLTLMWRNTGRTWEATSGLNSENGLCSQRVFPNIQFGFNRRKFKVTTMPWPGFIMKREVDVAVDYSGFCVDVLDEMARKLNFTYTIGEPPDGMWGNIVDGKWTGVIRQLIEKEVDFAATALTVDFARNQVIDFVSPSFFYDTKDIMYRTPDSTQSKWRLLLDVYKPEVLLCLALSTVIWTCFLSVMDNSTKKKTLRQLLSNLWLYMEQVWCSLLHQSSFLQPQTWSGRVLMSWWLLFGIVVSATYTANLMAFLAVPMSKKPFASLAEMLQNTEYRWGFVGGGSMQTSLSTSGDPKIKALWQAAVKFNQTDSRTMAGTVGEHLSRVMTEKYAYVSGHEKYGKKIDCHVSFVGEKLFQVEYSTGLPDGSPLKKDFDSVMSRMLESGLLKQFGRKWLHGGSKCFVPVTASREVVLVDVLGVLCIAGVGLGLAFTVLFAERMFMLWQKSRT